jgi:hypothetical protein
MIAPVTHFLPITVIRRARTLPVPGKVAIRKGQKVGATDVIAEGPLTPEHLLLDVARGLGLPANKADTFIQRRAGDEVGQGDVIAGPVGVTHRVIRAPRPGRVVLAGSGQVLMEVESQPFELKAGIPGVVVDLIPDRGAVIETTGALVQGVWGNGRIDFGLLNILSETPHDTLTADRLDVSQRGLVIFGGYCDDEAVLKTAGDIPLRGMILGSMDPSLIPIAARVNYPIIILEGFGQISVNSVVYKLLSTSERREVAIIADAWDRLAGTRPELVIPLPASSQLPLPREADHFEPGQEVRVLTAPYRGMIGTVVSLRPGLEALPSGVRALVADIRLENGESSMLPLSNLEVLE